MKKVMTIFGAILFASISFISCGGGSNENKSKERGLTEIKNETPNNVQKSTFIGGNQNVEYLIKELKTLSRKGIFDKMHNNNITLIPSEQLEYFQSNANYKILFFEKGDVFHNGFDDFIFLIFNDSTHIVQILIYNGKIRNHLKLYEDINVLDSLETETNEGCHYGYSGSLDYKLADNICESKEFLLKNKNAELINQPIKVVNIAKADDFYFDSDEWHTCFAKNIDKGKYLSKQSICISTSIYYNNWECIQYDKDQNVFVIFYGQAFSD